MQLFHGSLSPVVVPDFKLLNNKTDFGKGFYTTTDYDQAVKWTFVKKSRINSDKLIFRYVNEFEYNEDNDLNVLFVDMALFTCISLLAGVVIDLSYGFIDPRIRMGAKK